MTNKQASIPHIANHDDSTELIEHTDHGAEEFDRFEGVSFSDEDRVTLKHVAVVLAILVVIALTFFALALYE